MTQRMGHFVGLGSPQRMGTPYSLSLSLSLLPVSSPSMSSHQGGAHVERRWMAQSSSTITPERRVVRPHPAERPGDACPGLSTIEGVDLDAQIPCVAKKHDHPADVRTRRACTSCPTYTVAVCWPIYRGIRHMLADGEVCGTCHGLVSVTIVEVLR